MARPPGIEPETMPRFALVHRVALSAGATEHRLVGRVQALQSVLLAFEVSGAGFPGARRGLLRRASASPNSIRTLRACAASGPGRARLGLRLERGGGPAGPGSLAVAEADGARAWRALKECSPSTRPKRRWTIHPSTPLRRSARQTSSEPAMHVPWEMRRHSLDLLQVKIISSGLGSSPST